MGRHDEAASLYARAVAVFRDRLGDAHPETRVIAGNQANLLRTHFPDDPALAVAVERKGRQFAGW